ncbi:hypothetical protein [Streptomyces bauhiniae]
MRALIFGALLGLLLCLPAATEMTTTVATAAAAQPAVLAFAAGIAVRPALARRMRGWAA